jgi:hypothetical protein
VYARCGQRGNAPEDQVTLEHLHLEPRGSTPFPAFVIGL